MLKGNIGSLDIRARVSVPPQQRLMRSPVLRLRWFSALGFPANYIAVLQCGKGTYTYRTCPIDLVMEFHIILLSSNRASRCSGW
jgi:hypothetical protein